MKIREGFVKNAGNLNFGIASARSLAVRMGGTVLVKTAASRHRSAGGGRLGAENKWPSMVRIW